MTIARFPHGVSSFGIPVIGSGDIVTTGNVFFVDDSGSNNNSGTDPTQPFADLDYAIGRCTASQGDIIVVMPGHAETASTQVVCDVAGVRIVGLGTGRNRPAITANASAADCFSVTAANVSIENIRIIGAASCTALIDVAAADFSCINCVLEHGTAPTKAVTIPAAGLRATFDSCVFRGTAAGPDYGIFIEAAAVVGLTVKNCDFLYYGSSGLDNAGIASAYTNTDILISHCRFLGMDLAAIDFDSSAQGLVEYCTVVTTAITTVAEVMDVGDLGVVECYVTAEGAGKSGARIPATTVTA